MPVEIREIIIRAVLNSPGNTEEGAQQPDKHLNDKEMIVQACVNEVMRILKRSKQR
ncbi:hypothetical protein KK083_19335 [Fulvivirgaceae bacterium PWU4]|uniref:Uncharacterized protein n=1 Tax=Chryseosolibacter histidini TaxID=2782349 RepID=A0AAP2DQC7_9BACT|nr:DUF5908 family protein [Chryseosolibacter histidini]MBT1699057.1 hypothetical protein [Chryseosolibacter histidini]